MMRSLYAGISGLRNFQTKMDIIGNNIANVNTVSFKSSRITFAETMAQTLAGEIAPTGGQGGVNAIQVGLGMRTLGIDTNFSQGSLESTGVTTDLALQGDGFFMVSDGEQISYTRAGVFHIDADGNLVASGNGQRVMGYSVADLGKQLDRTSPRAIQIPLGRRSEANSTTEVVLHGNLDMNMTNSTAKLIDSGTTGITNVNGIARNGVGGTHQIEIRGENATRSSLAGQTQNLNLTDTLSSHNISNIDGFHVIVDGDRDIQIAGLTVDSTISDLINAINTQVSGVRAELNVDGAIQINRDYYGDGGVYNVELVDPEDAGDAGLVFNLFSGAQNFMVDNGSPSTLVVEDTFTSNANASSIVVPLIPLEDEHTGLVTRIGNLGGGGVLVNANQGLAAGTVVIETADTTHSTSIMVYDSLGNTHNLTMNYTRSEIPGMWRWSVELPEPAVIISGGAGEINFQDDGSLESFHFDENVTELVFNPGNGARNVSLGFDSGSFGTFEGMTQTASPTTTLASSQDGYSMGTLQGIFIDNNGMIFGNFSNGVTENLAQILIANFTNPQGLERVGENLYRQTTNSGSPRTSDAAQVGTKINSGYLEMSNVDLSREFTDMILAQRAFQASARVITTSDGLLEEVTRLKR